jgi:hypothetical protein
MAIEPALPEEGGIDGGVDVGSVPDGAPVHRRRRGRRRWIPWSWWRVLRFFFMRGGGRKRHAALEFSDGERHIGEVTELRSRGERPLQGCFWDFEA